MPNQLPHPASSFFDKPSQSNWSQHPVDDRLLDQVLAESTNNTLPRLLLSHGITPTKNEAENRQLFFNLVMRELLKRSAEVDRQEQQYPEVGPPVKPLPK